MKQAIDWLNGKKTYIMIAVDTIDLVGVQAGWWDDAPIRHIVEFAFTAVFARLAMKKAEAPKPEAAEEQK